MDPLLLKSKSVDLKSALIEKEFARLIAKMPEEMWYLEDILSTNKTYKSRPLRCPHYLRAE